MDKEHLKSAADKASGAAKEAIGKATGNEKLQAEGKFDTVKGEARKVVGDVKDAIRRLQELRIPTNAMTARAKAWAVRVSGLVDVFELQPVGVGEEYSVIARSVARVLGRRIEDRCADLHQERVKRIDIRAALRVPGDVVQAG